MIPVLLFPGFNPVAVSLGPLSIRWYALAYIVSLLIGWQVVRRQVRLAPAVATREATDDFLSWATLGVVLGGRLGYVLFYQPSVYFSHPLLILQVWEGGMSFHGGMVGVVIALILFCRARRIPLFGFADRIAASVPIGLGLGRIANFINGELWGREAPDWLPWAMQRSIMGPPLHPSQLYEALMEGLLLLILLQWMMTRERIRARFGTICGTFLIGYGTARIVGEFFREPDAFLGFLWAGVTMGQLLSLPMVLVGVWLVWRAQHRPAVTLAAPGAAAEAAPQPAPKPASAPLP